MKLLLFIMLVVFLVTACDDTMLCYALDYENNKSYEYRAKNAQDCDDKLPEIRKLHNISEK